MTVQFKPKQCVEGHGGALDDEHEANVMLDMVKQETERIDSCFFESACGGGDFPFEVFRCKTCVPISMRLVGYREQTLKGVITKPESEPFKTVKGLAKDDFELLLSLNVFTPARMNDAVYKFKRYEDDSLSYAGIGKHQQDTQVGLFDTAIPAQEFEEM